MTDHLVHIHFPKKWNKSLLAVKNTVGGSITSHIGAAIYHYLHHMGAPVEDDVESTVLPKIEKVLKGRIQESHGRNSQMMHLYAGQQPSPTRRHENVALPAQYHSAPAPAPTPIQFPQPQPPVNVIDDAELPRSDYNPIPKEDPNHGKDIVTPTPVDPLDLLR